MLRCHMFCNLKLTEFGGIIFKYLSFSGKNRKGRTFLTARAGHIGAIVTIITNILAPGKIIQITRKKKRFFRYFQWEFINIFLLIQGERCIISVIDNFLS